MLREKQENKMMVEGSLLSFEVIITTGVFYVVRKKVNVK